MSKLKKTNQIITMKINTSPFKRINSSRFLYEARINEALRFEALKELLDEQAKLYAKQKQLEAKLADAREDVKHWQNVVASERTSNS